MPTVATLLALLLALDPMGYAWATQYQIREESPLVRNGHRYLGWGQWGTDQGIRIDIPWVWGHTALSEKDRRDQAACVLPHEAAHIRFRTASEEIPLLYTYVCLDRVGASQWLKDAIYQQLLQEAPDGNRPGGD